MNTEIAPFLENLRHSTAKAHKDLESLPLSMVVVDTEVTDNEYADYLKLMHDVVADTEENIFPLLENIVPDLMHRTKSHFIDADLKALGKDKTETHSRPITRNLKEISTGFALGIMYVVEGSSLGGRVILKNITAVLGHDGEKGATYFAGYGGQTGSTWRTFLSALTEYESENNAGDEIIAGANYTFDAINRHFTENARV